MFRLVTAWPNALAIAAAKLPIAATVANAIKVNKVYSVRS